MREFERGPWSTPALALILLAGALAPPADAIPAFARKYGAQCSVCHDIYPKLNPFGRAFKEAGFVFPGEPVDWVKTIETIPLAARTEIDITARDDSQDEFFVIKPILAGNLGNRVSFWVDRVFVVFGTQPGEGVNLDVEDQTDNAWARFNFGPAFYVKGGKFELDLPYSSTRNYTLFTYEPWVTGSSGNATLLGVAQKGFELGGNQRSWRYSLAVVEGEDFQKDDFDGDVYVRVARDIDVHRVGGFFYLGENTQEGFEGQEFTNQFHRYGFDAEARAGRLDLHGVWMRGTDDQPFPGASELSFNSGFAQGDVKLGELFRWTNRLGFTAVDGDPDGAQTNYYSGLQHWALGLRMRLAIEYGWLESRSNAFQFAGTYVF